MEMIGDCPKLPADCVGGQHKIDNAGGDRVSRHALELGASVLREGDPTCGFDCLESDGSVGRCSGKNDSDRVALLILGERGQEKVDWQITRPTFSAWCKDENALVDDHLGIGRNDVNVVRRNPDSLASLAHRHRRMAAQQRGQHAFMVRIKMLDENECHAA